MRKILFRGKGVYSSYRGKWVYGLCGGFEKERGYAVIYDREDEKTGAFTVDESLGQYTGLTDKNGTEIFEGDLVKYEDGRTFAIKYSESLARFIPCLPNGAFNPAVFSNCEIVGNIYDNPDWGKGTEET